MTRDDQTVPPALKVNSCGRDVEITGIRDFEPRSYLRLRSVLSLDSQ